MHVVHDHGKVDAIALRRCVFGGFTRAELPDYGKDHGQHQYDDQKVNEVQLAEQSAFFVYDFHKGLLNSDLGLILPEICTIILYDRK